MLCRKKGCSKKAGKQGVALTKGGMVRYLATATLQIGDTIPTIKNKGGEDVTLFSPFQQTLHCPCPAYYIEATEASLELLHQPDNS